ncbi:MAG: heavy metal translocating P-type ATPase [Balneolaceae bacterium]|nr:MAG: heavy metal translocating P-type ATPase [Balneolaceae bacterium]
MKKTYTITGMHCAGCANSVKKVLEQVDGISTADVNFAAEKATIQFSEQPIGDHAIVEAVQKAGFNVHLPEKKSITFHVDGMHCTGCSSAVEKTLHSVDGVLSANVNLATETAVVELESEQLVDEIIKSVEGSGYSLKKKSTNDPNRLEAKRKRDSEKLESARQKMVRSWIVTLPLMIWMFVDMVLGIHLTSHLVMEIVMTAGATYVIMFPGYTTILSALRSTKVLSPNMDVLIAIGTVASLITGFVALGFELGLIESQFYSFAGIAAMIMAFHLTGRYIETKARGSASDAITKLLTLEAKRARIIKNGKEEEIDINDLRVDDVTIIRPGEKVPADGVVVDGKGSIDEAMVTGESMPVVKEKGDMVVGGTINTEGTIRVQVKEIGQNSFLNRIIALVEEAQGSKIPIQDFADRVTAVFVPVILVLASLTFLMWWFFGDILQPVLLAAEPYLPWIITDLNTLSQAFFASLAVLVIACPCALGLATPTALMVGTGMGAENGILIRKGEAIQLLQEVTTFVFDKTGTLTKGEPEVIEWIHFDGALESEEIKRLAASVENLSEHPISKAITNFAGKTNYYDVTNFTSYTGMGVTGLAEGKAVSAGNLELLQKREVTLSEEVKRVAKNLSQKGYSTIYIAIDGEVHAIAAIADNTKPQSEAMIKSLHKMGFKTVMLTGDQLSVANQIANEIGIQQVHAEVKPDEKASIIKNLQEKGEVVAMVGDGVNDAPALTVSDVGIAFGTGTDIAIESGSIILVDGNPDVIIRALNLSKQTFKKIKQNLFWAFFYNVVMIPLAIIGWMHPVLAEIAMAFSSINVVGNSKRLTNKSI